MPTRFEDAGSLPRPGPIGRVLRLGFGAGLLGFFAWIARASPPDVARNGGVLVWLGIALVFTFVPELVSVPLGRAWGRRPQWVVGVLAVAAAALDLARHGTPLGPTLGWVLFLLLTLGTGFLGLSFVLSGVLAVPG